MKHSQTIPLILTAAAITTAIAWTGAGKLSRFALESTSEATVFVTGAAYVYQRKRHVVRHLEVSKFFQALQDFLLDRGTLQGVSTIRFALARAPPYY